MTEAEKTLNNLLGDDLGKIGSESKEKLKNFIQINLLYNEGVNEQLEKIKYDYDHSLFLSENKYKELLAEYNTSNQTMNNLQKEICSVENNQNFLKDELNTVKNQAEESLTEKVLLLEYDIVTLKTLCSDKDKLIDSIQNDNALMASKIDTLLKNKKQTQLELDEKAQQYLFDQHALEDTKLKLTNLEKQIELFQTEIRTKDAMYVKDMGEKISKLSKLEYKLQECESQNTALNEVINDMQDRYKKMEEKSLQIADETYQKQNELERELFDTRNQLQDSQYKCSRLEQAHKQALEQYTGLKDSLQELQEVFTQTRTSNTLIESQLTQLKQNHTDAINQKELVITSLEQKLDEKDTEISRLKKVLTGVQMGDNSKAISSSGEGQLTNESFKNIAVTQEADTSGENETISHIGEASIGGTNMTFSELYALYISTIKQLDVTRGENKKLNMSMGCILQEIEEKGPLLIKQNRDYGRLSKTVDALSQQLDQARERMHGLKLENVSLRLKFDKMAQSLTETKRKIYLVSASCLNEYDNNNNMNLTGANVDVNSTKISDDEHYFKKSKITDQYKYASLLEGSFADLEKDFAAPCKRPRSDKDVSLSNPSNTEKMLVAKYEKALKYILDYVTLETPTPQQNSFDNFQQMTGQSFLTNINNSYSNFSNINTTIPMIKDTNDNNMSLSLIDPEIESLYNLEKKWIESEKLVTSLRQMVDDQNKLIDKLKTQNQTYENIVNKQAGLLQGNNGKGEFAVPSKDIISDIQTHYEALKKEHKAVEIELKSQLKETNNIIAALKLESNALTYKQRLAQDKENNLSRDLERARKEVQTERQQLTTLVNKLTEKDADICKIQMKTIELQQEISSKDLNIKRLESQIETLKSQMDVMSKAKSLENCENSLLNNILGNIKTLQTSFELTEKDTVGKLATENATLIEERKELKYKLESLQLESRVKEQEYMKKVEEQTYKSDALGKEISQLVAEKSKFSTQIQQLTQELNESRSTQFNTSTVAGLLGEEQPSGLGNTNDSILSFGDIGASSSFIQIPKLDTITKIKDEEIFDLKNTLKTNEEHLANYRSMAENMEKQLNQSQELIVKLETTLEQHTKKHESYVEERESMFKDLKTRLETQTSQYNQELSELNATVKNQSEEIERLQKLANERSELRDQMAERCRTLVSQNCELTVQIEQITQEKSVLQDALNNLKGLICTKAAKGITTTTFDSTDGKGIDDKDIDEYIQSNIQVKSEYDNLLKKYGQLEEACNTLSQECDKLKSGYSQMLGTAFEDPERLITLDDLKAVFIEGEGNAMNFSGTNTSTPAQNIISYINYLRIYNQKSLKEGQDYKIECKTLQMKCVDLERKLVELTESIEKLTKQNPIDESVETKYVKELLECKNRIRDFDSELRISVANYEDCHTKYLMLLDKSTQPPSLPDKVAEPILPIGPTPQELELKRINTLLETENTEMKHAIKDWEEKYRDMSQRLDDLSNKNQKETEQRDQNVQSLKEEIEDMTLKLAVYINKDAVNEDKLRDSEEQNQTLLAKIEEMRVTNNKIRALARKYKQLHEESTGNMSGETLISNLISTNNNVIITCSNSTAITPNLSTTQFGPSSTDNIESALANVDQINMDINNPCEQQHLDTTDFKNKYEQTESELQTVRDKCDDLQKELEEKNLRLASLKSQYEARINKMKSQMMVVSEQQSEQKSTIIATESEISISESQFVTTSVEGSGDMSFIQSTLLSSTMTNVVSNIEPSSITNKNSSNLDFELLSPNRSDPVLQKFLPVKSEQMGFNQESTSQPITKKAAANVKGFVVSPAFAISSSSDANIENASERNTVEESSVYGTPFCNINSVTTNVLYYQASSSITSSNVSTKPAVSIKPLLFPPAPKISQYYLGSTGTSRAHTSTIGIAAPNVHATMFQSPISFTPFSVNHTNPMNTDFESIMSGQGSSDIIDQNEGNNFQDVGSNFTQNASLMSNTISTSDQNVISSAFVSPVPSSMVRINPYQHNQGVSIPFTSNLDIENFESEMLTDEVDASLAVNVSNDEYLTLSPRELLSAEDTSTQSLIDLENSQFHTQQEENEFIEQEEIEEQPGPSSAYVEHKSFSQQTLIRLTPRAKAEINNVSITQNVNETIPFDFRAKNTPFNSNNQEKLCGVEVSSNTQDSTTNVSHSTTTLSSIQPYSSQQYSNSAAFSSNSYVVGPLVTSISAVSSNLTSTTQQQTALTSTTSSTSTNRISLVSGLSIYSTQHSQSLASTTLNMPLSAFISGGGGQGTANPINAAPHSLLSTNTNNFIKMGGKFSSLSSQQQQFPPPAFGSNQITSAINTTNSQTTLMAEKKDQSIPLNFKEPPLSLANLTFAQHLKMRAPYPNSSNPNKRGGGGGGRQFLGFGGPRQHHHRGTPNYKRGRRGNNNTHQGRGNRGTTNFSINRNVGPGNHTNTAAGNNNNVNTLTKTPTKKDKDNTGGDGNATN